MKKYFSRMVGEGNHNRPPRRPLREIFWSWLGAFVGIYAIYQLNSFLPLSEIDNLYIIGSFGATAVLIYGAPMADFSQPRCVVLGHLVSALTGVTISKIFTGNVAIAGALAVSLSIAIMHLSNSLHPPGGATALIVILGNASIHELGYLYVLVPVMAGVFILLLVALVVNNLTGDRIRHYPRYWC